MNKLVELKMENDLILGDGKMKYGEVKNPRKYTWSIDDDNWEVELIEHAKVPKKSFVGDNYFETEWFFIATKPASKWYTELGETRITGTLMTEYDGIPGRYEIIRGIIDAISDGCIEMAKHLCEN